MDRPAPVRTSGARCCWRGRPSPAGHRDRHGDARPSGTASLRCPRRRLELRPPGSWTIAGGLARHGAGGRWLRPRSLRSRDRRVQADHPGLDALRRTGRHRLLPHELSAVARVLPARVHDRYAAPRPGSPGAQACHPPRQAARPPVRAADHRRGSGARRRGGGSTAAREVVGLHRSGCAHRAGRACDRNHGRHPRRRPHRCRRIRGRRPGRRGHLVHRGRLRDLPGAPARHVGAGGHAGPVHRRPEPDRCRGPAPEGAPRRRPALSCTSSPAVPSTPRGGRSAPST